MEHFLSDAGRCSFESSLVSTPVGCQPRLDVNPGWVSTPVGCQPRLGVNPGWMSTPVGCQPRLDVNPGWMSTLNSKSPIGIEFSKVNVLKKR